MQRRQYFPAFVGARVAPDVRLWLEEKAVSEQTTASAIVRKMIERAAQRDLLQKAKGSISAAG